MSYDLYFTSTRVTAGEFEQYFGAREHYEVQGSQAQYGNEDTGVYFSFEYSDEDDGDGDTEDEDAPQAWASFNLNYFRPSYFAREAAGEIEAFVRRFGRAVSDPQLDGMSDADFSEEGFLRGWQRGNSFAFEALLSGEERPQVLTRSTQELTRVWQWNYARRTRQEEKGDDIFVPRIGYCHAPGWASTSFNARRRYRACWRSSFSGMAAST